MRRPTFQFARPLLAAIYAYLAFFGHGLHTHGPQEHGPQEHAALQRAAATEAIHACACGHDHGGVASHATKRPQDAPAIKRGQQLCDDCGCTACAVLAQMSVGYADTSSELLSRLPESRERLALARSYSNSTQRLADARGPPTRA